MKKFLVLLALVAMMLCTVALADAPIVTSPMQWGGVTVPAGSDEVLFEIEHAGSDFDWEIVYYIQDTAYPVDGEKCWYADTDIAGDYTIYWEYLAIGDATPLNGEVKHELWLYWTEDDGTECSGVVEFYVDWFGYEHPWGYGFMPSSYDFVTLPCWYPDNTACVFGPKVEGSWKTFAAVDLTVEGTQSFDLVAAGAWKIGTVFVTVTGDEVVVDYIMSEDICTKDVHDDITVDAEYVKFFADAASIDATVETAAFGTPISIANDLAGDTTVALYVELQVDYPSHSPFVTRFWPNYGPNKAAVKAMNELLAAEVVEEVPAEEVPAE